MERKTPLYHIFIYGRLPIILISGTLIIFSGYLVYLSLKVNEKTDHLKKLHKLEAAIYRLNEEYFHTQLEVWEYAYDPTVNRLLHVQNHRHSFEERTNDLRFALANLKNVISSEIKIKIEHILDKVDEIDQIWERGVNIFSKKDFHKNRDQFLINEKEFDSQNFGQIIESTIAVINEYTVSKRNEINFHSISFAIFLEIVLVSVLGILIYLHFKTKNVRKTLELKLVQMDKMSALGQLSAGMAHEVNNPLMFIQGFSGRIRNEILKRNIESASLIDCLDEIDSGICRIKKIVTHLKDYSRNSKSEFSKVDIKSTIIKSFSLFQESLKMKNVEVNFSWNPNMDTAKILVLGDMNRLEQVFFNLITNACDVLSSSTKTLRTISVEVKEIDSFVLIYFKDNGSGIPENIIKNIFDPFFTTKEVGVGTGLGLSIVQGIIHDHSGEISVSSILGVETIFTIKLPTKKI